MKILHLLSGGEIGGIEILCRDIAALGSDRHEFCFLYHGGCIAEEMKQCGVPVHFLYEQGILKRIYGLIRLVKREKYDVVIVHHEGIGIYSLYLILMYLFRKKKFIKYLHCAFDKRYFEQESKIKNRLNYLTLSQTLKHSDKIVAVSQFVKNSYCTQFKCEENKVSVIYNGIKIPHNNETIPQKKPSGESIRLLFIGRMVEGKGIQTLLYAMKKLVAMNECFELELLGEGPKRAEYEELAKDLEIGNRVHFYGQQLEKQSFYCQTDIFVYPSVVQEAFGLSIVEAMAAGKLCVASRTGGIPEIIQDEKEGLLFTAGDVDSLAAAVKKAAVICRSEEYDKIVMAARKKSENFSIESMLDKLQRLCRME